MRSLAPLNRSFRRRGSDSRAAIESALAMHTPIDPASLPAATRAARRRRLWNVLLAVLAIGCLGFGCLLYSSIRDIAAYANLPLLSGAPVFAEARGTPGPTAQPQPTEAAPQRINILLLGIDERDEAGGPSRTDTMILFSVEPVSKTVTMLSIPRDLWVPMPPEFTKVPEDRINTAFFYGDYYKYPGGGPALVKEAVQYNLGVPVQYYVRVNFGGFQRIIDEIGGIDIDVPRDIIDTAYPIGGDQVMTLRINAGRQHMNGDLALKYARTRHDSNDIDRARRQQQVILAVRDKILSLNVPLTRIPAMLSILGDSVQTDMPLDKMYTVAQAARAAQGAGIRQGVIGEDMVTPWVTSGGADVLLPQRDKISELIAQLFPAP